MSDLDGIIYNVRLSQLKEISKNLLDIVAAVKKQSKQEIANSLDVHAGNSQKGQDGSLSCQEVFRGYSQWIKSSQITKALIEKGFNSAQFENLAKLIPKDHKIINIAHYSLDPNDPDYFSKRYDLVPHGYGCTMPERKAFKERGEGKMCNLPEFQTDEEKRLIAAKQ